MRSRWTAAGRSRFKSAFHDHFAVLHHAAPLHEDVGKLKLIPEDQQIGVLALLYSALGSQSQCIGNGCRHRTERFVKTNLFGGRAHRFQVAVNGANAKAHHLAGFVEARHRTLTV